MDERVIIVRRMPTDLWKRLKIQAAVEERTIYAIVAEALERYLDQVSKAA